MAKNVSEIPSPMAFSGTANRRRTHVARDRINDLLRRRVRQLRSQLSQLLFRLVHEPADGRSRNRMERLVRLREAVSAARGNSRSRIKNCTTEAGSSRPCRCRYISNALAERRGARPLNVVERRADVRGTRQQNEVLHVEDPRRFIGPLDRPGRPQKCHPSPWVIVASVIPMNCWPEKRIWSKKSYDSS